MDQEPMGLRPVYRYLVGLALFDESFRAYLLEEPGQAAASVGVHLSDSQIEHLAAVTPEQVQSWLDLSESELGFTIMAASGW
jgi:hypothetical protein